ncbi:methylenetetrahydrofolate reductase [NAD(P)H] [Marinicellulosiphila megalodicopiae]|uniref:methylenetetrahydrofolate reductase [NAD(P)H] n=1 Tax=Marinicellulosiphila megalodicopiae TaxID=2724896 RepID=UPI003BB0D3D3
MNKVNQFSFEFFPAKTDAGHTKLQGVHAELSKLNPDFFSVTYGAGGTTQERTINTVLDFHKKGIATAPHLTCIGNSKKDLTKLLDLYKDNGINRIVTLRGDLPEGMDSTAGEFDYASDLVTFIKENYNDQFHLEVAAYPEMHPQADNYNQDINNFVTKVKAGADSAITQYFFNADAYFNFRDKVHAQGVEIDIIPGIMPITNFKNLARFSKSCGADIPIWMSKQFEAYENDADSAQKLGVEIVTRLSETLIKGGAPGLHFYSMNSVEPNLQICKNLGISV